ncbi:EndoU domain-containing protein [Corynebacterium kozikiae]|uniref:EndoU domain-containing protein n=1 Tax=Corynebacterium kozikiae TaxID=2968469 RepID=UPI00359C7A3C
MPGHVLHGWRDLSEGDRKRLSDGVSVQGWPHDESLADGHRWDSKREGASKFPKDWTDQKIVDTVRDAIEEPTHFRATMVRRTVWRETDDLIVKVEYNVLPDGRISFRTSYPVENIAKEAIEVAR